MAMKTMLRQLLGLFCFIFLIGFGATPAVLAQPTTRGRVGIDVIHSGEDRVGVMLGASIKDGIAASSRFAIDERSLAEISLVSLDQALGEFPTGSSSAVSVQYRTPVYCKDAKGEWQLYVAAEHSLYIVGRNRIDTIAKEIVAEFSAFRDRQKCY